MISLTISGLRKEYEGRAVLKDVNCRFQSGQLYVIKGQSGCGKSTLLSLVGLLEKPTAGTLLFNGTAVADPDAFAARNISYLFQDNNLFEDLTCLENLRLITSDCDLIMRTLGDLHIEERSGNKARALSKGEKARLALCRVIIEDKPYILLDEPLGNLDQKNAQAILEMLGQLSKTHLVLVVMHSDLDLSAIPHRVIGIADGELHGAEEVQTACEPADLAFSPPRSLSGGQAATFARHLLKNNPLKSVLYLLMQSLLIFVSLLAIGVGRVDLNGQIIEQLQRSEVEELKVYSKTSSGSLYRGIDLVLKQGEQGTELEALYSKDNSFRLEEKRYDLDGDVIYIPQDTVDEKGIVFGTTATIGGAEVEIRIGEYKYPLVSNSIVKRLSADFDYRVIESSLQDLMSECDAYFSSAPEFRIVGNREALARAVDVKHAATLKKDEVNLVFPAGSAEDFSEIFSSVAGLNYILPTFNSEAGLGDFLHSITIAGYLVDPQIQTVGFALGDPVFDGYVQDCFANDFISAFGKGIYFLSEDNYRSYDFSQNPAHFLNICNLSEQDIYAFTLVKSAQDNHWILLIAAVFFSAVALFFLVEGIGRSFQRQRVLLYTLGFRRRSQVAINAYCYNFLFALSALIGALFFVFCRPAIDTSFNRAFHTGVRVAVSDLSWLMLVYLAVLLVVENLASIFYKTGKNDRQLLKMMKKALE